jgi:hypothetical protein
MKHIFLLIVIELIFMLCLGLLHVVSVLGGEEFPTYIYLAVSVVVLLAWVCAIVLEIILRKSK